MVNIFFVFVYFRGIFLHCKAGGRMSSRSHGGYHRAKALLLMSVYKKGKEKIQITQKQSLGGAGKKIQIFRPDIYFGVSGGKQRNDKS